VQSTGKKGRDGRYRQWTSRSIGSSFQHNIFYALIRTGGQRLAYFALYFVVLYYTVFRASIRKKTEYYLSRRFPQMKTLSRLVASYRLSLEFGKVLVDKAIVGILGPEEVNVRFRSKDKLKGVVNEGKGIILMAAHVGCWQVAMSALEFLDVPVNMLLQQEEGDVDRQYFEHSGIPCPYNIIDPWGYLGGSLEMISALKRGEVLCVMGDRIFGSRKNTVGVDFFGEKVLFPFSAFKIASATGSPVAVFFSWKTGTKRYELDLVRVIRVPEGLGRSGDKFIPYVKQFVEVLESFAMEHPYQFFNFYDMWDEDVEVKN